jgi:hypothetical protein
MRKRLVSTGLALRTLLPLLGAAALVGCNSSPFHSAAPAVTATPNVAVTTTELEGNWGLASYRNEADRPRTEKEAKSACGNPYVVARGPTGGVMMHLADQTEPQEVFLKVGADGNVFVGPKGPAGVKQDRHITAFSGGVLTADWMDPSAKERYGTMVFVRCGTTPV